MNREKIFKMTNGKCFYCGQDLNFENFHIDHLIPKAKGGRDSGNVVPACTDCNFFKSNKSIEEFRADLEEIANKSIHTRLMARYHDVKKCKIVFWYERQKGVKG